MGQAAVNARRRERWAKGCRDARAALVLVRMTSPRSPGAEEAITRLCDALDRAHGVEPSHVARKNAAAKAAKGLKPWH